VSAEAPPTTTWKVTGDGDLHWRCWQGDYIVFNPLSGNTHLLDIVAGKLLLAILAGQMATDELTEQVSTFLEVEADTKLLAHVVSILEKLDELGLVEPVVRC
jgi:PqqD family protein of HPr-rel-A system